MDDIIDRNNVKKMIRDFYKLAGISLPSSITINNEVARIFFKMIQETKKCSNAFVLVPQPPSGPATVKWLAYNLSRTIFQSASSQVSITCVKVAISNWNTKLRFAGMGL